VVELNILLDSYYVVLALESWHKGTNTPSIGSLVVNEERMWTGHGLGSVLCVPFSALTLMDDRKDIRPVKTPFHYSQRFCCGTRGGGPEEKPADPASPRIMAIKWK